MKRGDRYQISLIILGLASTLLFGFFFYKELFPEYKIYQNDYIALEEFRSKYTGEAPPAFKSGVKQLVFERSDKGPEKIDRCTSCHVAVQLPHFSSTTIERDKDGHIVKDKDGKPIQIPNVDYIWAKLDKKIIELKDETVNSELSKDGRESEVNQRLKEAANLESLKTSKVHGHEYDVVKVLSMHPLIGNETRPFELHPLEEYGCTSCHSGNGRALTIDKAHGPVFDGFYEEEFMGETFKFIEEDSENDPKFSKVFNHKPGDALLFQTSPILVGNLIQSSCIQCHEKAKSPSFSLKANEQTSLNKLTKNYHRGEELYISQACYACHKISGTARGGVGPDLTLAGNLYPWYLKESIVWPQADLPTSTMPNFHLDSDDVEDLMTYLLAQKGMSKKIAEIDYKTSIQRWENGEKLLFEKSIPPSKIEDLNYSMTVFATEGCAACHRLKGFESNVGFINDQDEKLKSINTNWFKSLFHEEIPGTEIVKAIENHKDEINKRISSDIRNHSILEKIEEEFPGIISSFYSNFKFASRAKNHEFKNIQDQNLKSKKIKEWQDLVHRILMVYIQEYGLGRVIGPKLNWSGIYRSDEWLMEHFKNPGAHVPKSIMPIFPFDESKFYALTYMLDILGKKNRNQIQNQWLQNGFNPENAYELFCSQCHGTYLQGNGPVSEWIYPIPKNLRNAEFLKNLTRNKATESIAHGVSGTPMAPWGEAQAPKPWEDQEPVLTSDQIHSLVDWLFSSLPNSAPLNAPTDILKWDYLPKDVIEELKSSHTLKKLESKNQDSIPANSKDSIKEKSKIVDPDVNEVFEIIDQKTSSGQEKSYFINKKYYTQKNIQEGLEFFNINCASCHGADADGAGARASIMHDAKPRMLTNFDWLNSQDDLYLLRSIKYGVPGTAMTPWGDLTSSLQRIQLVIFIRSLSEEKEKRVGLQKAIYETFEVALQNIDKAQRVEYPALEKAKNEYDLLNHQIKQSFDESQSLKKPLEDNSDIYRRSLKLNNLVINLKAKDQLYIDLKTLVNQQKEIYLGIGNDMINLSIDDKDFDKFLSVLKLARNRLNFKEGNLIIDSDEKRDKKIKFDTDEIIKSLNEKIESLNSNKDQTTKTTAYEKLKNKITSGILQDQKLIFQEALIIDKIQSKEKIETKSESHG